MIQEVTERFRSNYNEAPMVVTRAPGRVEVIGNHTDYNEGYVLSCAIDREIYIAAGISQSGNCEFCSTDFPGMVSVSSCTSQNENGWVNYPLGVYRVFEELGYPVSPIRMAVHGNIPMGAGLSSSAALEVGTALALCRLFSISIEPREMAKLCQKAENEFVGTKCGLLDQFSSLFGKANNLLFIDFRTLEHDTIPLPDSHVILAVATSGVTHSLVESAYNDRRRECFEAASFFHFKDKNINMLRDVSMPLLLEAEKELDPIVFKRALHVVGENDRVLEAMSLLKSGAMTDFGSLLYQSHESSKTNFENSCPELDILVENARHIDTVYGSRLTGGGFGGATLSFLQGGAQDVFKDTIVPAYKEKTGHTATVHFARIADGAQIIS
jgi:galactokinase